jgi:hypothetical protein
MARDTAFKQLRGISILVTSRIYSITKIRQLGRQYRGLFEQGEQDNRFGLGRWRYGFQQCQTGVIDVALGTVKVGAHD